MYYYSISDCSISYIIIYTIMLPYYIAFQSWQAQSTLSPQPGHSAPPMGFAPDGLLSSSSSPFLRRWRPVPAEGVISESVMYSAGELVKYKAQLSREVLKMGCFTELWYSYPYTWPEQLYKLHIVPICSKEMFYKLAWPWASRLTGCFYIVYLGTLKLIPTPDFRTSPDGWRHRQTRENKE